MVHDFKAPPQHILSFVFYEPMKAKKDNNEMFKPMFCVINLKTLKKLIDAKNNSTRNNSQLNWIFASPIDFYVNPFIKDVKERMLSNTFDKSSMNGHAPLFSRCSDWQFTLFEDKRSSIQKFLHPKKEENISARFKLGFPFEH